MCSAEMWDGAGPLHGLADCPSLTQCPASPVPPPSQCKHAPLRAKAGLSGVPARGAVTPASLVTGAGISRQVSCSARAVRGRSTPLLVSLEQRAPA